MPFAGPHQQPPVRSEKSVGNMQSPVRFSEVAIFHLGLPQRNFSANTEIPYLADSGAVDPVKQAFPL